MSEIKKLEQEAATAIHEAFDKLRAEAEKIISNLTFRIKQGLHPTNHEPVDSHSTAASEALSKAVEDARASLLSGGGAPEAPSSPAGSATAIGASTTLNSGLMDNGGGEKAAPEGGEPKPGEEA